MGELGWTVVLRHPNGTEVPVDVDDQTVAYEIAPFIRALCSWLAPATARISIAGSVVGALLEEGEDATETSGVHTQPTSPPGHRQPRLSGMEDGSGLAYQVDTGDGR